MQSSISVSFCEGQIRDGASILGAKMTLLVVERRLMDFLANRLLLLSWLCRNTVSPSEWVEDPLVTFTWVLERMERR